MASSEVKEWSYFVNLTRCESNFKLTIKVENKSMKSFVKGRSSSVIRNSLEDVWCILDVGAADPASDCCSDSRDGMRWRVCRRLSIESAEKSIYAGLDCSLLVLPSDNGGVSGLTPPISWMLIWDGLRECFERLPAEADVRSEELVVLPIAERLARALEVFSRAKAANDRRLRREIEPITEPVKLDVVVVVFPAEVVAGVANEVERGGREEEEEEEVKGRSSAGVEETGAGEVEVRG